MERIVITPIQKRDLKLRLHPYMRDIDDIVTIINDSANGFYDVNNSLSRGLNRHYEDLNRISRRNRTRQSDSVILMNLLKSLDQACNAICMTLDHFSDPIASIADQQKQYALIKSRQNGRDRTYNRYRHASSNYRIKSNLRKLENSSSSMKKSTIKVGIPKNIFGVLENLGIVSSEKTLKRAVSRLNDVLLKIVKNRDDVLEIIDDILYTLNKINPDGYPDKSDRIKEVQALRTAVENSFKIQYEHILNFKISFEQNVSLLKQNVTNAVNEVKQSSTDTITDEEATELIRNIMETT